MTNLLASDATFTETEQAELKAILDRMIPAHGARPSAADDLIFADLLATARPAQDLVRAALAEAQTVGLDALSRSQSAAIRALTSLVVQCYYRDDRVMADLQMDARPPHPQGYAVPEGDWSLLDPVRTRDKMYRPTEDQP